MDKNIKNKVINREYGAERFGKDQQIAMGNRIRKLREEADLTMGDIADVLRISDDMMSRLENGRSTLKTEHIFVLAQLYDVSAHYILCGEDERILTHEIDNMCFWKSSELLQKAVEMLDILFQ